MSGERGCDKSMSRYRRLVVVVGGAVLMLALMAAPAFAQFTDPFDGASEGLINDVKSYAVLLAGVAIGVILVGIAYRMLKRWTSKASSS